MKITSMNIYNIRRDGHGYVFDVQYYTDHDLGAIREEDVRLSARDYERMLHLGEFEVRNEATSFQAAIGLYMSMNPVRESYGRTGEAESIGTGFGR